MKSALAQLIVTTTFNPH